MNECHHSVWRTLGIVITTVIMTLFLEVILIFGYIWFKNPFGIRDLIRPTQSATTSVSDDAHPLLTAQQEQLLFSLGINPGTLPTELTPELKECLLQNIGTERAAAIKAGETPTIQDILDAKPCLSLSP